MSIADRRLPRAPHVPPDAYRQVLERLRSDDGLWRRRVAAIRPQVTQLQQNREREVRRLLGQDRFDRWRRHVKSNPARRVDPVLQDLGVNQQAVISLNQDLQRRLTDLLSTTLFTPSIDELPGVTLPVMASVFRPPFAGMHSDDSVDLISTQGLGDTSFSVDPTTRVDVSSGSAEASVRTQNPSAGDDDGVLAISEAWVGFFYRTPREGPLRIVVNARATMVQHSVTLTDEWGWSKGLIHQGTVIEFRCTSPQSVVQGVAVTTEVLRQETSGTFTDTPLPSNAPVRLGFTTDGRFQAGTDVWVEVAAAAIEANFVNDVSVDSKTTGRWVIESVSVASSS